MLEARTLSCRRGGRPLFCDLSFAVAPGDFLQVTGANGSGKSSLLRLLAGLLAPVAGAIVWQGGAIAADFAAHHARLHYIGHQDALKPELTAAEMRDYWRALRPGNTVHDDAFGIDAFRHRPVRWLSAGQKRRLALSRLLLNQAPLWILDEPATALDADAQQWLAACIAAHCAAGGMAVAALHQPLQKEGRILRMPGTAPC